jgi:hypothetical protein
VELGFLENPANLVDRECGFNSKLTETTVLVGVNYRFW